MNESDNDNENNLKFDISEQLTLHHYQTQSKITAATIQPI